MKLAFSIALCSLSLFSTVSQALEPTLSRFEPVIENTADNTFGLFGIKANRNSQIATLYKPDRNGPDHLLFFGENLSEDFVVEGQRFVDLTLSNWGAAILDFQGPGTAIWAAPIGEPPVEVSRVAVSNSTGVINDAGRIALFSREDNSHGDRDIYVRDPGELRRLLPDLEEDEVIESPLIDGLGRIIARHEFESPEFDRDVYRFTDGEGWENLTASRLPDNVLVSGSVNSGRERAISPAGDFVFSADRTTEEGIRRPEVFLWDDSQETIESIFDQSSQFTRFSGNPFSLNFEAQFSDSNDLWLMASRFSPALTEFRSLYRRESGEIVDVEALLPTGFQLVRDVNYHDMNHDGDLWVAARREGDESITYFFVEGDRAIPVLSGVSKPVFSPVLTNSHELYVWLQNGQGSLTLGKLQIIPEPSSVMMAVIALGIVGACSRFRPTSTHPPHTAPRL